MTASLAEFSQYRVGSILELVYSLSNKYFWPRIDKTQREDNHRQEIP